MENKQISENTTIKLKMSHVIGFLGGLTTILVAVIGFFYTTLTTQIEKKVEKELYEQNKEYFDEKFSNLGKDFEEIKKEQKITNDNIRTIGTEVKILNANKNSVPNTNTQPVNNHPINPDF